MDSSQKNIIFLARTDNAEQSLVIAGMYSVLYDLFYSSTMLYKIFSGQKVGYVDEYYTLHKPVLIPTLNQIYLQSMIYSVLLAQHRFNAIITC